MVVSLNPIAIALSAPYARLIQRRVMVIAWSVKPRQHQALSVTGERPKSLLKEMDQPL
jgi:hypothetical protein